MSPGDDLVMSHDLVVTRLKLSRNRLGASGQTIAMADPSPVPERRLGAVFGRWPQWRDG